MLDRISEINVSSRYKGGNKQASKYYVKGAYESDKESDHDSLSLSPAFRMASKFRLKIKEITKESADKYYVVFELNDFAFKVKVELSTLLEEKSIVLQGSRDISQYSDEFRISFWVNYHADKIADDSEIILATKYISKLSDRVEEMSMGNDYNIYNESSLHIFTDEIEVNLTEEFHNICSIAVKLIEKMFEQNISAKMGEEAGDERFFTLQLVKQTKL